MPVKNLEQNSLIEEGKKFTFDTPPDKFSEATPGGYTMIDVEGLERLVDKKVEEKIKKFFEEKETINFRKISDSEARKEIVSFILEMKKNGFRKISILDIVVGLNLSPIQVEKIMKRFEKEKSVKRVLL